MMGRTHLVVNGAILVAGVSWLNVVADRSSVVAQKIAAWPGADPVWDLWPLSYVDGGYVVSAAEWFRAWLNPYSGSGSGPLGYPGWLLGIALVLYFLGTLLPDIDSAKSLLGRFVPGGFPGPHRGLMHSNWLVLSLLLVSLVPSLRIVIWLVFGALLHQIVDGMSHAGRAAWYPLGHYRDVDLPDGEVLIAKRGFHIGLYKAGGLSEYIVAAGIVALCVWLSWLALGM